jgi:hypothetical protein
MLPSFCWLPCLLWLSPWRRSSCGGHWRRGHGSGSLSCIVDVVVQTRNFFLSQFKVRNHHVTLLTLRNSNHLIVHHHHNSTTAAQDAFVTQRTQPPGTFFFFFFFLLYYILINRQGTTTTPGTWQMHQHHRSFFLYSLILILIYCYSAISLRQRGPGQLPQTQPLSSLPRRNRRVEQGM